MRVMIEFSFPTPSGNEVIRSGKIDKFFRQINEDLKPEAAYFFPVDGVRGGIFIVNMTESSQVADIGERF